MVTSGIYKALQEQFRELRLAKESGNKTAVKEQTVRTAETAARMMVWNCLEKYRFVDGDEQAVDDAVSFLTKQETLKQVFFSIQKNHTLNGFAQVLQCIEQDYVDNFYSAYFYARLISHKGHIYSLVMRKYWMEETNSWQSKKNGIVEAEFCFPITKEIVALYGNRLMPVQNQG